MLKTQTLLAPQQQLVFNDHDDRDFLDKMAIICGEHLAHSQSAPVLHDKGVTYADADMLRSISAANFSDPMAPGPAAVPGVGLGHIPELDILKLDDDVGSLFGDLEGLNGLDDHFDTISLNGAVDHAITEDAPPPLEMFPADLLPAPSPQRF